MDIKYRVEFTTGGHYESRDLESVKTMRDNADGGGLITQIEMVHTISNDPHLRNFDSFDLAADAAAELRAETFQPITTEFASNPQPEGLN